MEQYSVSSKLHTEAQFLGLEPAAGSGLFGGMMAPSDAKMVLLGVPFDATASYGSGAEFGPDLILSASHQLDLEDPVFDKPYLHGIALCDKDQGLIRQLNQKCKEQVLDVARGVESKLGGQIRIINECGDKVNDLVYERAKSYMQRKKIVGVIGGDHSSPYGLIRALAEQEPEFGVLHIDAHYDLRDSYQGFEWSHASIMHNILRDFPSISSIVHVGVRDFSNEEKKGQSRMAARSSTFPAAAIFEQLAAGKTYQAIVAEIISTLPERVYISFDIDGLDPSLCPGTGTPVPGGLEFFQATYLIDQLYLSGRKIVGFDLCEVASKAEGDEWDGNVGARILYKLCGAAIYSGTGDSCC